ncbi:MAG: hypothetical protein AAF394_11275, partial [Planctomycetota bacterium]
MSGESVSLKLKLMTCEALKRFALVWEGDFQHLESYQRAAASLISRDGKAGELHQWYDQESNPMCKEMLFEIISCLSKQFLFSIGEKGYEKISARELKQFRIAVKLVTPNLDLHEAFKKADAITASCDDKSSATQKHAPEPTDRWVTAMRSREPGQTAFDVAKSIYEAMDNKDKAVCLANAKQRLLDPKQKSPLKYGKWQC